MGRRLFVFISAVSLVLCLSGIGLWHRSSRHFDAVGIGWGGLAASAVSDDTSVTLNFLRLRGTAFSALDRPKVASLSVCHDENRLDFFEQLLSDFEDRLGDLDGVLTRMPGANSAFAFHSHDGYYTGLRSLAPGELSIPDYHWWQVAVPQWFLSVIAVFFPIGWVIVWRRRLIAGKQTRCGRCNYDLRAMPSRCPECGAVPIAAKA